ncbi:DUF4350 domain-containing protein [Salinactinospora qingdaonensis]|uniref:DUF4350 domain-containing protein n=1 Tax=Salinactinospora qingdaonensis TaxID=702744 RepID=A0ABP7FYJ9_9ACTN
MSAAPTAPAPESPSESTQISSVTPGQLWRRWRGPLAFAAGLILIAIVVSLGSRPLPAGDLDPDAPNPTGSRALAQILGERGAEVTIARDSGSAIDAVSDTPDALLLVAHSHRLTAEELTRLAEAPGHRLLIRPTTQALERLAPGVTVTGRSDAEVLTPECALAAATAAGDIAVGGTLVNGPSVPAELYTVDDGAACYPAPEESGSALVRTDTQDRTVTVLGTGDPLRNFALAERGNAALLLNLALAPAAGTGSDSGTAEERHVVWLLPDVPTPGEEQSLWSLLPDSVPLSLIALVLALALLALWRGRRLGPLVAERLPVVVRAAETTEGRARLYTARRARDRAALALRSGCLERIRPLVELGPDASPETVVEAVAARTGEDPRRLGELLYGAGDSEGHDPYSADDHGLVRLADELDRVTDTLR